MFRIKSKDDPKPKKPEVQDEAETADAPVAEPEPNPTAEAPAVDAAPMGEVPMDDSSGGLHIKLSPLTAGYLGPENGPFECGHCHYFSGPSSCQVVDGEISPEGCCNNFSAADTPDTDDQEAEGPDAELGQAPPGPPLQG